MGETLKVNPNCPHCQKLAIEFIKLQKTALRAALIIQKQEAVIKDINQLVKEGLSDE